MKKFPKWILILAVPCILMAIGYFALMQYYQVNIPYGTWINDVYCTGMTYEEVGALLLEKDDSIVSLEVLDRDDKLHVLTLDTDVYQLSYKESLKQAAASFGAMELFKEKSIWVKPAVRINSERWGTYIRKQALFKADVAVPSPRMSIVEGKEGFELIDAQENVLDNEKASKVILEAFEAGEERISLKEAGCYYTPAYSSEDKAVIAEYEALQLFCNKITLDLTIQGEVAFQVKPSVLKDWVLKEADGSYAYGKGGILLLDEAKVKEYAQGISDEVTTYFGKPWQFVDHNGDTVEVKAGNYGRVLKTYALTNKLLAAYNTGTSGSYELEFVFHPASAADNDYGAGYGDSYVEVDLEEQHVYLYIDGELKLDSPCVTGDVRRKRETPKGTFYIEYKQRNRTLRGEDYATPVSYWMHFYNHCGFHDAYWRRSFGEDIYINDGSHGCVNMPPAKAKELYNLVEKGMPVFVY